MCTSWHTDRSLSLLTDEHKGFSHRSHRFTQMIHVLSHGTDARSKSRDKARFGYALQEGGRPKVKTTEPTLLLRMSVPSCLKYQSMSIRDTIHGKRNL